MAAQVTREPWALRETRPADAPATWKPSEVADALFTLANGSVGVRGTLDEGSYAGTRAPCATYLNGTYDESPVRFPHDEYSVAASQSRCDMFRVPDATSIEAVVSQHGALSVSRPEEGHSPTRGPQKSEPHTVLSHTRSLDLRNARVERHTSWKLAPPQTVNPAIAQHLQPDSDRVVRVSSTRLVSLGHAAPVLAVRYVLQSASYAGTASISCVTRAPDRPFVSHTADAATCRQPHDATVVLATQQRHRQAGDAMMANSDMRGFMMSSRTTNPFGVSHNDVEPSATLLGDSSLTPGLTVVNVQAPGSRAYVACASYAVCTHISAESGLERVVEAEDDETADGRGARSVFHVALAPGDQVVVERLVCYASTQSHVAESTGDVGQDAVQAVYSLMRQGGFTAVNERHETAANALWESSALNIDGDDEMVGALRANMLHVIMNTGRTRMTSLGMKGLTGDLLAGHYSWDGEIFVMPFLAWTQPALARALLQFRIDTFESARGRVRDLMLPRGALYPWRTIDGSESHAATACTMQLHMNADIAYAFQLYLAATGDLELFINGGAHVVLSTALVWLHWGTWDRGKFHLRYVTGPDEYNVLVNDNCFTNLMAANHLRFAVQLGQLIARHSPALWRDVCDQTELDPHADLTAMQRAADNMYLPFDADQKVYLQDDAFLKKKPWGIDSLPGVDSRQRPTAVLSERYHPLTIYRHRVCKQADVLLAQSLLDGCFAADAKLANFKYYENLTTHDSSLTTATFSVVASSLGFSAKAFEYFRRTACVDVENIVGNSAAGLHMAAMGGSWNCVVAGFAGLRADLAAACTNLAAPPTLQFDPYVPERWSSYTFTLVVRGALLDVEVNRTWASYRLRSPRLGAETDMSFTPPSEIPNSIAIRHGPERRLRLLLDGDTQRAPLHRAHLAPVFDAVVFDVASLVAHVEDDHFEAWKAVLDPILREAQPTNAFMTAAGLTTHPGMMRTMTTVSSIGGASVGGDHMTGVGSSLDAANSGVGGAAATVASNGLTREQYFAYVRYHPVVGNKRFSGVLRLLQSCGLSHIAYGEPNDPPETLSVYGLANRKKLAFREVVKRSGGVRPADGVEGLLRELKGQKIAIGCASSSRNAQWLLEEAGIAHYVDYIADGSSAGGGDDWRDGVLIQRCASQLNTASDRTVVVIDSIAGLSQSALHSVRAGLIASTNGDGEADDASVAKQYGVHVVCGPLAGVSVEDLQRWVMAQAAAAEEEAAAIGSSSSPAAKQLQRGEAATSGGAASVSLPGTAEAGRVASQGRATVGLVDTQSVPSPQHPHHLRTASNLST